MSELIQEIDAFCKKHEMSASDFGTNALNDRPFVSQIRNGRRFWPETETKVRAYMASFNKRHKKT